MCVDPSDAYLYGDYNSDEASIFNIQLVKCHDRDDCWPEHEILEFLKNKFILVRHNIIRFDSRYYDAKSIIPESQVFWLPINT